MLSEQSRDQQLSINSAAPEHAPIGNIIQQFEIWIHPIKLINRNMLYDI